MTSAETAPERQADGRRCPICGAPASPAQRPFCSRRCADLDLGRWLKEQYRIPTAERPGESAPGEEDDGPD